MFGLGSIGNFLPLIGSIGSGFSGGGLFGLGFTLLSGLLNNIGSPRNPGFENFASHPGFQNANTHPGFGTMGPNVSTVGNMNGYFGTQYSGGDYSILPQTPSGQYHANQGYSHPNRGVTYAQTPPPQFGGHRPPSHNIPNLNFGGPFSQYRDDYNSVLLPQPPFIPFYQHGQHQASYGSAPAPAQQNYHPVMSHYGFGAPQQYNPAATLFGHQSGSVQIQYGQPQQHTTYGGPQDGDQSVVHHHHHHHLHIHTHDHTSPPAAGDEPAPYEPVAVEEPSYGGQEPVDNTPAPVDQDYTPEPVADPTPAYTPEPEPEPTYEPAPDPVAYEPTPEPTPEPAPYEPTPAPAPYTPTPEPTPYAPEPEPYAPVEEPAQIVDASPVATQEVINHQTSWGRVPHVNTDNQWYNASKVVENRITGGDPAQYAFGGRDPRTNADGLGYNRKAAWHVFQANESLRLDMDSGYFYETNADGSTANKFHMSAVSALERQAGNDHKLGFDLVANFLDGRDLLAAGVTTSNRVGDAANAGRRAPVAGSTSTAPASGRNVPTFNTGLGRFG